MTAYHHPRKRYGQNFLKDSDVIAKIVRILDPKPDEMLVEIGAGLGALTTSVLNYVDHLHVIEIDRDLAARLQKAYPQILTVHQGDALHFDFSSLEGAGKKMRVFGNLPYNISTPLLFHLLSFSSCIEDMLFMLQKEVVMRICAPSGGKDYGRLSVMIQYACQANALFDIAPKSFSPSPKVMSTLVHLKPYGENCPFPRATNEPLFSHIVNVAFSHRRKTLKNALEGTISKEVIENAGIDPMRRPETLTIAEFIALSDLA